MYTQLLATYTGSFCWNAMDFDSWASSVLFHNVFNARMFISEGVCFCDSAETCMCTHNKLPVSKNMKNFVTYGLALMYLTVHNLTHLHFLLGIHYDTAFRKKKLERQVHLWLEYFTKAIPHYFVHKHLWRLYSLRLDSRARLGRSFNLIAPYRETTRHT